MPLLMRFGPLQVPSSRIEDSYLQEQQAKRVAAIMSLPAGGSLTCSNGNRRGLAVSAVRENSVRRVAVVMSGLSMARPRLEGSQALVKRIWMSDAIVTASDP